MFSGVLWERQSCSKLVKLFICLLVRESVEESDDFLSSQVGHSPLQEETSTCTDIFLTKFLTICIDTDAFFVSFPAVCAR